MMRFSALLTAGLAVLDSAYAVQSEDNSLSTTSSLFAHPSHAHHSSSSYSLMHVHNNSTKTSIKSSQTPHLVVRPTITKDQPHTKQTSAMDKTSRTTTKSFSTHSTHTQLGTSSRISETATGPVHTSTHAHPDPSSTNPKTNTTFSTKPNTKTKTHNTKSTDTPTHKTNTSRKTSKDETTLTGDKKTHTTHHASHSEHTHAPAYLTAPFVVHSITVPAQTAVETGDFSTRTLSDHTGPPNSYSATTVTGNDHHPTILPVWFNKKGHAIVVNPVKVDGPHGIIPPPEGLPKLNIGPDGNPTPDPSNDDPPKTSDPNTTKTHDKTSKKTHDHTTKTHDKTTSKKTSEKTSSTSSKTTSTSSATTTTSTSSKTTSTSSATTTTSTSTPTGKSTQYLILPKKDSTEKQHNQITSKLIDMAGKSKVNTKDYKMDGLGFWTATLNSTQVDEIKKESIVEGVVKDEIMTVKGIEEDDKKTKRTDGIESFRNLVRSAKFWKRDNPERQHAPLELALISQPKDNSISKDVWGKTYQYDESAGKGITVYVVDTGASPQNNEYKKMPGKKSWIYAGALGAKDHDTDKDDKFGHGTCVLSKVAGPKYGVSKNVDIVVIKMQAERPKDANGNQVFAIHGSTYLSAIQSIIYDIKSNKRQGKAVINMSFGLPIANMFFAQYVESVTKEITGLDVPIIVAAGNEASSGRKEVDTYPALWAKKNDGIIVVGSTGDNNHISSFSQDGPLVTVYAPGDGIVCAAPGDGDAEQHQQGTSFAAPAVAGLTAYLMALPSNNLPAVGNGKIPGQLRGQLKDHASWARVNGGPKIIWNGQDTKTSWDNQDCDSDGSILKRRGGSPKCSASVSTGTKTSTATNTASKSTTHSTTKVTKTSHSTTKGTTTSHHTTTAKTTHATTTSSKTSATKSSTKSTPASLWCAPTHKASATIPADKAHDKVESFCKAMLKQEGSINGFYPMSHDYKKYAKTYKLGNVDTTFNLNWVSGRQAGINVKMCEDMLSEVIDDCSGGYGGGIPHDGIPTGVASFNVTLGKDD